MQNKHYCIRPCTVSILTAALIICVCSIAQCKFRPPDTGALIHDASVVAVIHVQWIRPVEKQGSTEYGEGNVTARALEILKGRLSSESVCIRTDSHMETGDTTAYCPEHKYLVFLVRSGSEYKAEFGRFGVFPIDEQCQVYDWNKPGVWRSYPDVPPKVEYKAVRKQIVDFLSKRGEYHPIKNAPVFNCAPVQAKSNSTDIHLW